MKILYITGTHSSGKSALVKSFQNHAGVVLFSRQDRSELFSDDDYKSLFNHQPETVNVFGNLSDRIIAAIDETKKQIKFSSINDKNIIMADHFLLDCMAYILTCFNLKWLTKKEFYLLSKKIEKELVANINSHCYGLFLKPPLNSVRKNFMRINPQNSRYWEKKTNFLEISYKMFDKIYINYINNSNNRWGIVDSNNLLIQKLLVIQKINHIRIT